MTPEDCAVKLADEHPDLSPSVAYMMGYRARDAEKEALQEALQAAIDELVAAQHTYETNESDDPLHMHKDLDRLDASWEAARRLATPKG